MKLKLKEEPREWRNFVLVWCAVLLAAIFILTRKGAFPAWALIAAVPLGALIVILAAIQPRLFRSLYRLGMTATFYLGQAMARVILTLVFWLAVVPMSLLLRLLGKDVLELHRPKNAESYWKAPRRTGAFEQQF